MVPLAPQRKVLLDACERYLKYLPKGEKRVEIAYKAAKLYYDHHRYDEAVFRFSEIALTAPDHKFENGDRAGEIAANLVLDSYNALERLQEGERVGAALLRQRQARHRQVQGRPGEGHRAVERSSW